MIRKVNQEQRNSNPVVPKHGLVQRLRFGRRVRGQANEKEASFAAQLPDLKGKVCAVVVDKQDGRQPLQLGQALDEPHEVVVEDLVVDRAFLCVASKQTG
jgi:hypothetical protein